MTEHTSLWTPQVALGLSGWIALLLAYGPHGPLRVIGAFLFISVCPGLAVIELCGVSGLLERCVLSVALSTALSLIVSELLALVHLLTAASGLFVLASLTTALVLATRIRAAQARSVTGASTP